MSPASTVRVPVLISIVLIAALLLAGCFDGGGGGVPDTTPPTISMTNPANAATGVFVDGSIRITFSEPMDPATVNPANFRLENDANHTQVLTSVGYAGDIVTFTPVSPQPLARSTVYTATITTGVKDLAGNAIAAAHSWSFTTETDAWQTTNVSGAPAGRTKHSAVWTGSEMIAWGGQNSGGANNSGGRYDPVANAWIATTLNSAPAPRLEHTAIWTGTEMIVWGGWDGGFSYFNNGAAYDPVNGWRAIATPSSFSGRRDHTAVWTGTEMIVMGGFTDLGFTNTGAAYNPATDTWRSLADPSAGFSGRSNHTAVWTGTEVIVWGGNTNAGVTNNGAAYDPATDTWRLISTSGAPAPRLDHTAVWSGPAGISMVVWGGQDGFSRLQDGGRYDPVTDSWRTTDQTSNFPTGRFDHTAVWTGTRMIVWGGDDQTFASTGGRYTP